MTALACDIFYFKMARYAVLLFPGRISNT